jgi:hypothetical protein
MVLSSTTVLLNNRDARSLWQIQAIMTNRVGLLLVVKSNENNPAMDDNHLLFPLIALSKAIKRL